MSDTLTFDKATRHYVFLTAAWIAEMADEERGEGVDALCKLREALDISPAVARRLRQRAQGASTVPLVLGLVG